jgi:uncharacterized membrane protein HdeD (DUF308 family)
MNDIPWTLVVILVILVLLGIAVVTAIRKRKQPRRVDYRNHFWTGIVSLATGVFLVLLPWVLHGEVSLLMGGFFLVMGVAYVVSGLRNREKWGEQVLISATTTRKMIVAVIVLALLVLGIALFVVYGYVPSLSD